jgi:hypothetical protein
MNNTAWHFSGVNTDIVGRPYTVGNKNKDFGFYEVLYYPCSQLKTSIVDLSRYLLMHMNYGILDGVRIIDNTTEAMMRHVEHILSDVPGFVKLGYSMGYEYVNYYAGGVEYVGHSGGFPGVATDMYQNIINNTGAIVFQNVQFPITRSLFLFLDEQVTDTLSTQSQPLLSCSYTFNPCQQTMEYWQNNLDDWAINSVPMKLGKHYYNKQRILDLLSLPINDDASRVLAKALITAKLNIAQGSELAPIVLTYNSAMDLLGNPHLPYDNPVPFNSPNGIQMLALAATLNAYNLGNLNTNPCLGVPPLVTHANSVNEAEKIVKAYSLSVFPNPTSTNTTISFTLPQKEKVAIRVFDMTGRFVKQLADRIFEEGNNRIEWNTINVQAGTYLLKIETAGISENKKLVVAK